MDRQETVTCQFCLCKTALAYTCCPIIIINSVSLHSLVLVKVINYAYDIL